MRHPLFSLAARLPSGAAFTQNEIEQLLRIVIHGPEPGNLLEVNHGADSLLLSKLLKRYRFHRGSRLHLFHVS
jgi:hypothetical protein